MSDIVLGSCKPPGERPITVTVSRVIDAPLAEVSRILLGNWTWEWLDKCPQAGLAVLDVQQPTGATGEHAGVGVRAGAQRNLMMTSGPASGACMVEVLDGVRDGGKHNPHVGYWHSQPEKSHAKHITFNDDETGMSADAARLAAEAVLANLPRTHKVLLRIIGCFPQRSIVEWRVVLTPRRARDDELAAASESPAAKHAVGEAIEEEAAQAEVARLHALSEAVAAELGVLHHSEVQ